MPACPEVGLQLSLPSGESDPRPAASAVSAPESPVLRLCVPRLCGGSTLPAARPWTRPCLWTISQEQEGQISVQLLGLLDPKTLCVLKN